MKKRVVPFGLLLGLVLGHCANPVTPTGGNKDIDPPNITFTSPEDKSVNNKPKQVTFKFDENVQVNNAKEQIVISPKPLSKAEVKTGTNTVVISFKEGALKENTTYSINLNESIKDLNESNLGLYNPFLFSTGVKLDTQKIKGKCVFIDETNTRKVKIQTLSETVYHNIADKSLGFTLAGLPEDSLYLLAFNDLNSNDSFELNEDAGLIRTKPGDSAEIIIYPLQRKKLNLYKYGNLKYGLTGIKKEESNSLLINFRDTIIGDSSSVFNFLKMIDSTRFIIPKKAEKKSYNIRYILNKPAFLSDSFQQIKIVANDKFLVNVTKRQPYINRDHKLDSSDIIISSNTITYQFKNNSTGNVSIPLNYETVNNKIFKDTLKTTIPVYTSVILHNNEFFEVYVSIKNKNTGEVYSNYIKPKESSNLWMLAGDHEINYYADENRNSMLDGPDFSKKTAGAYYYRLPDIRIKENMAVDLKLKGSEKP